jgi:hypothetical protein
MLQPLCSGLAVLLAASGRILPNLQVKDKRAHKGEITCPRITQLVGGRVGVKFKFKIKARCDA